MKIKKGHLEVQNYSKKAFRLIFRVHIKNNSKK